MFGLKRVPFLSNFAKLEMLWASSWISLRRCWYKIRKPRDSGDILQTTRWWRTIHIQPCGVSDHPHLRYKYILSPTISNILRNSPSFEPGSDTDHRQKSGRRTHWDGRSPCQVKIYQLRLLRASCQVKINTQHTEVYVRLKITKAHPGRWRSTVNTR